MKKEHLPIIGVGPLIVIPQLVLAAVSIGSGVFEFGLAVSLVSSLKMPFTILGAMLIAFGIILWCQANFKVKIDKHIEENSLATTGVYAYVRNPIYSAFLLLVTGAVLLTANVVMLVVPVVCWLYMTIFLKITEERWLEDLYGQEYLDYCKMVNRCIPWFPKE